MNVGSCYGAEFPLAACAVDGLGTSPLLPSTRTGAAAAGLLLPCQMSMVGGKQAATHHAESDAAHQRQSWAQTPGRTCIALSFPQSMGGRGPRCDPGAVLPSDGFFAVGEHHHVCVHLVNLDTGNHGAVVVLPLAWTIITLALLPARGLPRLRSGLLHAWPCYLPWVVLEEVGHASAPAVWTPARAPQQQGTRLQ